MQAQLNAFQLANNSKLNKYVAICTNRDIFVNTNVFFCISVSKFAHATKKNQSHLIHMDFETFVPRFLKVP